MNTSNTDVLKQFSAVVNRNRLTEELYDALLKRWDLDKIDLDEEYIKIKTRKSSLSKSRREAVPEFIRLRDLLKDIKDKENSTIIMENELSNNEILMGGDFGEEVTNQHDTKFNAEIC